MIYLGLDYGRKKIGLSIGLSTARNQILVEPYLVIRYKSRDNLIKQIKEIVKKECIDKIIVGVSENRMGRESREFAKLINADVYDETLTTQDAFRLSIQNGIKRKRRKNMEDAYAAAIMLQNYLDDKKNYSG